MAKVKTRASNSNFSVRYQITIKRIAWKQKILRQPMIQKIIATIQQCPNFLTKWTLSLKLMLRCKLWIQSIRNTIWISIVNQRLSWLLDHYWQRELCMIIRTQKDMKICTGNISQWLVCRFIKHEKTWHTLYSKWQLI